MIAVCRDRAGGGITNRELWEAAQLPLLLILATGIDLPLYPLVREGHPVAVLKEALSDEEEQAMARYLMDAAKAVAEWAQTEL